MKTTTLAICVLIIAHITSLAQSATQTFNGTISQIRALTGTTYLQAVSTNYGTGTWYLDLTDTTTPDNTGTVLVDADGKRWKRLYSGAIFVNWFGATGDGVTNDQSAIQACFNASKPYQTISFNKGTYNFSSVTLTTTDFKLTGDKANLLGTITIGDDTPRTFNSLITGLTFTTSNSTTSPTGTAIQLSNCKKLQITNNVFNNCDKAITVLPNGKGKHTTGVIEISGGNLFTYNNYCFYVMRNDTADWETTNDCTFAGNVANPAKITAVYCNGIDGLKYSNNTIFMQSGSADTLKKHYLQIDDQSDWVIVNGNNFFESGEEGLLMKNCKTLNVTGNNFAWSGQKNAYSVIRATGTISNLMMNVTGNVFNGFSANVVRIDTTTYGAVNLSGNNIYYTDSLTNYFGKKDTLSKFNHYIIRAYNALNRIFEKDYYNNVANLKCIRKANYTTKFENWGSFGSQSYVSRSISFIDTSKVDLIGLYDAGLGNTTFGGTLNITAKNSSFSNANTSTYILIVNKASTSLAGKCDTIRQEGLLTGTGSSHPSFTFTVSGNRLMAKPVGLTRGTFYFYVMGEGDLTVTE